MVISRSPTRSKLSILGRWVDSTWGFETHLNKIAAYAEEVITRLTEMAPYIHPVGLRAVWWGCGVSKLTFAGPIFWPALSSTQKDRLERIHAKACRVIIGASMTSDAIKARKEAGFRDLDTMQREKAILISEKLARMSATPLTKVYKEEIICSGWTGERMECTERVPRKFAGTVRWGQRQTVAGDKLSQSADTPAAPLHSRRMRRCRQG